MDFASGLSGIASVAIGARVRDLRASHGIDNRRGIHAASIDTTLSVE